MFEEILSTLASDKNCTYTREDFTVAGNWGASAPVSIHRLRIAHEGLEIQMKIDLGNHNLAEVNVVIPVNSLVSDFKLTTKEQLSRLFSFDKSPWKVKTKDPQLNREVSKALDQSGLTKLAKDEIFVPTIEGLYKDLTYTVFTRYYLGFNNKEKSVELVIEFYKELIQHILSNYGNKLR